MSIGVAEGKRVEPSQELEMSMRGMVLAEMIAADAPLTRMEIESRTGFLPATIRSSLYWLAERGFVYPALGSWVAAIHE